MGLAEKLAKLITNQSELSRTTGIAQSAISEATAGKRRLYADQAFALARALGVSLDYLLDDGQAQPDVPLSDVQRRILRLADVFDDPEKAYLWLAQHPVVKEALLADGEDPGQSPKRRPA